MLDVHYYHVQSMYFVPGTGPKPLQLLTCLFLVNKSIESYCYSHFTDVENEIKLTQRCKSTILQ